jgi:hypothetical protein
MESSVLDQLRLQEGRLFQSESVLALYLDVKAVINETFSSCESSEKRAALSSLSDDYIQSLETMLRILAPKGVSDYHVQSLNECVKTVARLLWPTEHLLVARPNLNLLFKGILKRITQNDNFLHFKVLDPIKQDFVIREAFRRTLVNDCLIVFPTEISELDSASQAKEDIVSVDSFDRPIGAHSTLGPVAVEPSDSNKKEVSKSPSVSQSVVRSQAISSEEARSAAPSVAPSVAPRVVPSVATSVAPSVATSVAPSVARSVTHSVARSVSQRAPSSKENIPKLQSDLESYLKENDSGSALLIDLKISKEHSDPVPDPVPDSVPDSVSQHFDLTKEIRKPLSVANSVIHSVMPKVTSAPDSKSIRSHLSSASYNTTATLHKPLNVRKVILEEE